MGEAAHAGVLEEGVLEEGVVAEGVLEEGVLAEGAIAASSKAERRSSPLGGVSAEDAHQLRRGAKSAVTRCGER